MSAQITQTKQKVKRAKMPSCMWLTHVQQGATKALERCLLCPSQKAEKCPILTTEKFRQNCSFVLNGPSRNVYAECRMCTQHNQCPAIVNMRKEQVSMRLRITYGHEISTLNAQTHITQPYVPTTVWVRHQNPVTLCDEPPCRINLWIPVVHKVLDATKITMPTAANLIISNQQSAYWLKHHAPFNQKSDVFSRLKTPLSDKMFMRKSAKFFTLCANNGVKRCTFALQSCSVCAHSIFCCTGKEED